MRWQTIKIPILPLSNHLTSHSSIVIFRSRLVAIKIYSRLLTFYSFGYQLFVIRHNLTSDLMGKNQLRIQNSFNTWCLNHLFFTIAFNIFVHRLILIYLLEFLLSFIYEGLKTHKIYF